jgi:hypothetical protein
LTDILNIHIICQNQLYFLKLRKSIFLQGSKEVKAVERKVRVLPSGRVSSMELYMQHDNGKSVQMKEGETIIAVAGQTISGLSM